MKCIKVVLVLVAVLALTAGVAFGESVKVMTKAGVGNYLADSEGMTLYYFKNDSPGESTCTGGCLDNWPVFYEEEITVPEGLDEADFDTIDREDGTEQTTFKGYPLYYFVADENPGDTKGEGVGGVWFVVDPASFMKAPTSGY